ncbi:MAG: S1 family peptidase, partial [bacterium]|nr:S1 family peptidase [bacterium]
MRKVANTVIVVLAVAVLAAPLQARLGTPPRSMTEKTLDVGSVEILELDAVNPTALLLEDQRKAAEPGPLRFALPADVRITPADHGTWKRLADGRLWQLRVVAPGATDLNFGFGRFRLPKGATLHVLSLEEGYYQGPYTGADHHDHGQLWTPVVPGAAAMVELYVPADAEFAPELELVRVGRGYRDLFSREPGYFFPYKQGSCNIDVICPLGDDWRDQIRAVAVYGTGGSTFCTGTLLNNLEEDLRPFFLTANHCGITSSNAASVVVYWNYESSTCGALSGGSLSDNTSGATFRASDYGNDMTLIELNSTPNSAYDVYYSGWDARTSTAPQSSIGIHHPSTDEKAISYNDDALTTVNSCIGTG